MALLETSFDWLTELPQGNVGLWLALIASWGAFVVAIMILQRRQTYIEFHDNWTAKQVANTITVSGAVTVVSPAARMDATCRAQFGKVSALWLWYGRFRDPKGVDLALTPQDTRMRDANAYVLTFSGQDISIPGGRSEAAIAIQVKLSDGSKKRMTRKLAPLAEDSTED